MFIQLPFPLKCISSTCCVSALTALCAGKIVPNKTWSLCLRKGDAEREGVSYSEAFSKSKFKTDPTFASLILFICCWVFLAAGELLWIGDHRGSVKSVSFPAELQGLPFVRGPLKQFPSQLDLT